MINLLHLNCKSASSVISKGEIVIDYDNHKVTLRNEKINLSPKEFDLLYLFMTNPGKSCSRENLLSLVWGYEFSGYEHIINSHNTRLRTKIETDLDNPAYILTTFGICYRFNDGL